MKKIIYLHIGTHKTGTTYIQNLCGKNYDLLKSNGVLYPFQGRKPTTGHHNIGWFYSNRGLYFKDTPFSTKELIKEIESTSLDKILISSEVFSSDEFNSLHIEKIKSDLSNYEVHPVIFIRNPLYSIYSFWQEWVKHGLLHSFETCLKDENYVTQRLNSPSNIIKKWHHAFNENITIVVYDNLKANYTDVALYLLNQIIGIHIRKNDLMDFNTIINQGLTIERAELICEINNIAGTAAWRSIDIDGNYQALLEEASFQKYNLHYSDYIDKNIQISNSLLKQYRKLIVNPIGENCLYHNQNCTPTFEVLPRNIFKGKVIVPRLAQDFSDIYQINDDVKKTKKELNREKIIFQASTEKRINWLLTFLSLEYREFNQENYQIFLKTINSIALMDPTQLNEILQENPEIKNITKQYLEKYQGLTVQITKKLITQKRIFLD